MQINKINNVSFGKVIIKDKLTQEVIDIDYNTPQLKSKFEQLCQEQETNPYDIYLDSFLADKNEIPLDSERWYQKAAVGKKVFNQRIYAYQGGVMDFFEDACRYANRLKKLNLSPEAVEKASIKNALGIKLLSLCKRIK